MFASEAICIADIFVCLFEFPVKEAMNTAFIRQQLCFYLPLDLFVYVYVCVLVCPCAYNYIVFASDKYTDKSNRGKTTET